MRRRVVAEHCVSVMKQFKARCVLIAVEAMSTTALNIRWNNRTGEQALPISHGAENSLPRIGVKAREQHCPSCDSIVYSRRHRLCGVCGDALPKDCLFTPPEAENVETLLRTERQRHRFWMKKTTAM